jgi:hypothetical protein
MKPTRDRMDGSAGEEVVNRVFDWIDTTGGEGDESLKRMKKRRTIGARTLGLEAALSEPPVPPRAKPCLTGGVINPGLHAFQASEGS